VSTREKPAVVAPASSRQGEKSRQDAGATESVSIRSRGRLPHWERAQGTYFVTFRLAGTLPSQVLESWEADRRESEALAKQQGREPNAQERQRLHNLYTERIDAYLDSGAGACWLRNPKTAYVVVDALRFFDGQRYDLHAWSVMPNHVHVVLTVAPASSRQPNGPSRQDAGATKRRITPLASILHSWKSYTANQANRILHREGEFWQREYYDHLIRDDRDFERCVAYTVQNPVKAGLCERWEDWPWSGLGDSVAPASSRQAERQSRQDAGATTRP